MKKVKVCKKCCGFNPKELKKLIDKDDYKVECIGECARKRPELSGKVYGFIKGKLTVCDTKEEFFEKIKQII